MDPLSITTSAITLIQAAGGLASSLGAFARALRTADSRISGLCDELSSLTGFLESVDRTLKGCRRFDLDNVDEDIWRQSERALANCHFTLNELGSVVNKINGNYSRSRLFGRKARAVVDLNIYGDDLVAIRDKIHQSNWALQTMLHTITLSLSLRNNASQDTILRGLDKLKASIDQALYASSRPPGKFTNAAGRPDARVTRNLRELAEAAKHFHSSVSSTASTIRGDCSEAPWQTYPGATMSLMGDFPSFRRERVEEYLQAGGSNSPELRSQAPTRSCSPRRPSLYAPVAIPAVMESPELLVRKSMTMSVDDEDEEDAEHERAYLDGLQELAVGSIRDQDFNKAIECLQQAIERETDSTSNNREFRQLKIQLSLCYFLQGNWRLAKPIVMKLAQSKADQDMIVCNLLHALALAHLSEYCFEDALAVCKQALYGKKRVCKCHGTEWEEHRETLSLYATIFDVSGDYIRAEVFRRQLPSDFVYLHPESEIVFLRTHSSLLQTVLGDNAPDFGSSDGYHTGIAELDAGMSDDVPVSSPTLARSATSARLPSSTLRMKMSQHQRYEADTAKEVLFVGLDTADEADADDEASPTSPVPESPIRQRLGRLFSTRRAHTNSFEKALVAPDSSSEDEVSSPIQLLTSKWLHGNPFRVKRSKSRQMKKARENAELYQRYFSRNDKNRSFKLIRMEQITGPSSYDLQGNALGGRPSQLPPIDENVAGGNASESLSDDDHEPGVNRSEGSSTSEPVDIETDTSDIKSQSELANTSPVPELPDTGLSAVDILARKSAVEDLRLTRRATAGQNKQNLETADLPLTIDHLAARVLLTAMDSLVGDEPPASASTEQPQINAYNLKSFESMRLTEVTEHMGNILNGVSTILAALSTTQDVDTMRAGKRDLEALLPSLRSLGHDQTTIRDVAAIIRRLDEKIVKESELGGDSGYESMAPTKECPEPVSPKITVHGAARRRKPERPMLKTTFTSTSGSSSDDMSPCLSAKREDVTSGTEKRKKRVAWKDLHIQDSYGSTLGA